MATFYENKDKSIMCPHCKKLLTYADRKDPREHRLACKHCGKWIWYTPLHNKASVHKLPDRQTASGKRFF